MRCDHCKKFRRADDLTRLPVTQADYLFGDPGPFFICSACRQEPKGSGT